MAILKVFKPNVKATKFTPTPARQEQTYDENFQSFIFKYGQPTGGSASIANGTTTLYEVPDNYYLFINSICLGYRNDAAVTSAGVQLKMLGQTFILLPTLATNATMYMVTLPFPLPIRLNPKEKITIQSDVANQYAIGSFSGFLVQF